MTSGEVLFSAMKAAAWERAKGELRSLVAIKGSMQSVERDEEGLYPFQHLERHVEAFIAKVEGDGLHE